MEKNRIRALRSGDTTRISYSKINEVLEMPNLIEVQKNSYQWFLDEGLKEVFEDISPITDFSGNLILEFIDFSLDSEPKYSIEECRERDALAGTAYPSAYLASFPASRNNKVPADAKWTQKPFRFSKRKYSTKSFPAGVAPGSVS